MYSLSTHLFHLCSLRSLCNCIQTRLRLRAAVDKDSLCHQQLLAIERIAESTNRMLARACVRVCLPVHCDHSSTLSAERPRGPPLRHHLRVVPGSRGQSLKSLLLLLLPLLLLLLERQHPHQGGQVAELACYCVVAV